MQFIKYIVSAGLGLLGGLIAGIMAEDNSLKSIGKRVIIGFASGLLFSFTGLPNHINTFFAGYAGSHFIDNLYAKYKNI